MDTVHAIEDQLHTLRPICSPQSASAGMTCRAPAVAVAEIQAIDGCNRMGLRPDGDLAEKLCQACLATVQCAMTTYVAARARWRLDGTHRVCTTCRRLTRYLRTVFAVRPIGSVVVPS
jgi:hypothetical protein